MAVSGMLEAQLAVQHALAGRRQVPLLLDGLPAGTCWRNRSVNTRCAQRGDALGEVGAVEQRVALLVDHLALVVGHVVVLEQLLADVEVARLDLALRALDAAR
jgi:hypothetical protein